MAISPASMTTPESMALIPLGAWVWASGSQVCSGTRAVFDAKADHDQPAGRQQDRAADRCCLDLVQVERAGLHQHQGDAEQHQDRAVALWTTYFTPASSEAGWSR